MFILLQGDAHTKSIYAQKTPTRDFASTLLQIYVWSAKLSTMVKQLAHAKGPPSFQKTMSSFFKDIRNKEKFKEGSRLFSTKLQKINKTATFGNDTSVKTVKNPTSHKTSTNTTASDPTSYSTEKYRELYREHVSARPYQDGFNPEDLIEIFLYQSLKTNQSPINAARKNDPRLQSSST